MLRRHFYITICYDSDPLWEPVAQILYYVYVKVNNETFGNRWVRCNNWTRIVIFFHFGLLWLKNLIEQTRPPLKSELEKQWRSNFRFFWPLKCGAGTVVRFPVTSVSKCCAMWHIFLLYWNKCVWAALVYCKNEVINYSI